jgi:hypothetical protein
MTTTEITKANLAGADEEVQELLGNKVFRNNAERLVAIFLEDQSGNEWKIRFALDGNADEDRSLSDDITLFFIEGFFSSLLEHSELVEVLKAQELSDEEIKQFYDDNEMIEF